MSESLNHPLNPFTQQHWFIQEWSKRLFLWVSHWFIHWTHSHNNTYSFRNEPSVKVGSHILMIYEWKHDNNTFAKVISHTYQKKEKWFVLAGGFFPSFLAQPIFAVPFGDANDESYTLDMKYYESLNWKMHKSRLFVCNLKASFSICCWTVNFGPRLCVMPLIRLEFIR